jgi:hypothetical protein
MSSCAVVVKLQGGAGSVYTAPTPYTTSPTREIVMPIQCTCLKCGTPFVRPPSSYRVYCSPGCRPTTIERFWAKTDKNGPVPEYRPELGPCWLWTACISKKGYGQFGRGKRVDIAHRVSYELEYGPIPDGLGIDHLCRVRHCVRPSHLEAVTSRVNSLRGFSPPARNARVTQCPSGHPYDLENTYRRQNRPGQPRECRACGRTAARRYLARKLASKKAPSP